MSDFIDYEYNFLKHFSDLNRDRIWYELILSVEKQWLENYQETCALRMDIKYLEAHFPKIPLEELQRATGMINSVIGLKIHQKLLVPRPLCLIELSDIEAPFKTPLLNRQTIVKELKSIIPQTKIILTELEKETSSETQFYQNFCTVYDLLYEYLFLIYHLFYMQNDRIHYGILTSFEIRKMMDQKMREALFKVTRLKEEKIKNMDLTIILDSFLNAGYKKTLLPI